MTITLTQETAFDAHKATSATSHTFTVTATAPSATLIVAIIDLGSGFTGNATGVTDNKSGGSNTWNSIGGGDNAGGGGGRIFATAVGAAGSITTFTVAMASSAPVCVQFWEVAGLGSGSGAGGCDVVHTGNGASGSVSSGSSGTPAGSGELVIAVGGVVSFVGGPTNSSPALTTGGGTFVQHNNTSGVSLQANGTTARLNGVSAAQTFTFTTDGSNWGAAIALWKSGAVAASRTTADTAGGTDVATRATPKSRTCADTAGGTDTAVKGVFRTGTAADTAGGTDAATRAAPKARTCSDTAGGTDTASRASARARTTTDIAGASDSATIILRNARICADVAGGTDVALRNFRPFRTANDTAGGTDVATAMVNGGTTPVRVRRFRARAHRY